VQPAGIQLSMFWQISSDCDLGLRWMGNITFQWDISMKREMKTNSKGIVYPKK